MLRLLFGEEYGRDFGARLWDGTRLRASKDERFVLQVNAPGALRSAFTPPIDLSAGRAFGAGLLDVDGDLEHAVDTLYRASASLGVANIVRLLRLLRKLPKVAIPGLREAHLRGKCTHAREIARRSDSITISPQRSIAAFSIGK